MSSFDSTDPERRPPSPHTPRCKHCGEAAMSRYDGYCFRHVSAPITASTARAAIRSLRR